LPLAVTCDCVLTSVGATSSQGSGFTLIAGVLWFACVSSHMVRLNAVKEEA